MNYLQFFVYLSIVFGSCQAKTIKKAQANLLEPAYTTDSWQGKWFPQKPGEPHVNLDKVERTHTTLRDNWIGKWFPYKPGAPHVITDAVKHKTAMTDVHVCDDGRHNLGVDYDPLDISENYNYLCISSNRSAFNPNMSKKAVFTEHFLPKAYMAPAECMNSSINYTHQPPTNGAFRPIPVVYGTYKYLPPQRYLRNLAEGAIVMLYHPCAYPGQIKQLQLIVRSCLYRHIITPSLSLNADRPLALVAWSKSLAMSVVDKHLAAQFIVNHAKSGPLASANFAGGLEKRTSYNASLQVEAHLVTDLNDSELCGYQEM